MHAVPAERSAGTQKGPWMCLASLGLAAALGMLPDPGDACGDLGRAAQRELAPVNNSQVYWLNPREISG